MSLIAKARQLLATEHTASIATVSPDGDPWISNLYYALLPAPGISLAVLTAADSAHARHWQNHPLVAVSVFSHPDVPRSEVRGLQLLGHCKLGGGQQVKQSYLTRFPDAATLPGSQSYYVVDVSWLRLLERRTGYLEEATIRP